MLDIVLGRGKAVRNKGKSLITLPTDYTVIDIETTGLDPNYNSIIEVSAIRYRNNELVASFSSLLKPDDYYILDSDYVFDDGDYVTVNGKNIRYVDGFITQLTGITNEMLSAAPDTKTVLSDLYPFLGEDILIGHNVNFDINFLYDNFVYYLNRELKNDFVDTMRLSRRILTELKHHRLKDVAEQFSINTDNAHRALKDCEITNACYFSLKEKILNTYNSLDGFFSAIKKDHSGIKASDVTAATTNFDITHPLYSKLCVFTGALERMLRKDAMQKVVDLGGLNGDSVTAKTNFLILGNNDYCKSIKDGKSNKQKKAEMLKLEGYDIEIITENVFYDMLENN